MAVKQYLDYAGLTELVAKIKELVTDAGHIVFKGAVADVAHLPTLDSTQEVGFMYTILAEGQTTADFTDGAGLFIAANSEVAVVEVDDGAGGTEKKWVLLGPIFDVADKLTFGLTMPASPADGDTFLYLGDTTYDYNEVTPAGTENPQEEGWYVSDGEGGYTLTTDTEVQSGTTYYERVEEFVQGVIYVYDESTTSWVAKTAGDTIEGIPVSAVDALFD